MDPITTAIVAALAKMSEGVIKDSYDALKAVLKKKFGEPSNLIYAIDNLEKKPDSEDRKTLLQEAVEKSKVNDEPEIQKLVQNLLDKIKEQPGGQEIITQTQTINYSGTITVSGGSYAPHNEQIGKKN